MRAEQGVAPRSACMTARRRLGRLAREQSASGSDDAIDEAAARTDDSDPGPLARPLIGGIVPCVDRGIGIVPDERRRTA